VSELGGVTVCVAGLGVSGAAAARVLLRAGARVRAVDDAATSEVTDCAEELRAGGAEVCIGGVGEPDEVLAGCELVVPSPGMAPHGPLLAKASEGGLPVWSEPELAWRLSPGATTVVAVTGTNGKTTTTELLAEALQAPPAGNIGTPLIDRLLADAPPATVAVELSSFQLAYTETLRCAVAALLNVADDHLDWHGTRAAYRAAKANVWANQRPGDWAISGADDPGARATAAAWPPPARHAGFTLAVPGPGQVGIDAGRIVSRLHGRAVPVAGVDELRLSGPHNLANVAAAAAAAEAAGTDPELLGERLARCRPGAHRLEHVGTVDGVDYVDDSKATNPHAAAAAVAAYDSVVWIAGGLGKGLTFDAVEDVVRQRVHAVVTVGEAGPAIAALARSWGVAVTEAGDLVTAVSVAASSAADGDTVLLAPACASQDQFHDYAARGAAFRDAVASLGTTPLPHRGGVAVSEATAAHGTTGEAANGRAT
jgi:UDP-N-acetylmuramoylalanine--D-glutamate ligase